MAKGKQVNKAVFLAFFYKNSEGKKPASIQSKDVSTPGEHSQAPWHSSSSSSLAVTETFPLHSIHYPLKPPFPLYSHVPPMSYPATPYAHSVQFPKNSSYFISPFFQAQSQTPGSPTNTLPSPSCSVNEIPPPLDNANRYMLGSPQSSDQTLNMPSFSTDPSIRSSLTPSPPTDIMLTIPETVSSISHTSSTIRQMIDSTPSFLFTPSTQSSSEIQAVAAAQPPTLSSSFSSRTETSTGSSSNVAINTTRVFQ